MNAPAPSNVLAPGPGRALGGIWRLTYPGFFSGRRLLILAGLAALLYLLTAQNATAGTADYYRWAAEFYLTFLLPTVTFLAAAGAVREDMDSVSVDYLLTRPVRRASLVALRYVSQLACLQLTALIPLAAVMAAGVTLDVSPLWEMLPILLLAQVLAVSGFSALGFLFGALTTRYFVLGVVYGLTVEIGVGQIPTQISRLSMTHHILAMLSPWIPDARGAHDVEPVWVAGGAILVFMLVSLAGAMAVFSLREFTGSGTSEK